MTYKWKDGFRANVKAEVAGAVCSDLERRGELTAENLVNVSRPVDAPLHKFFEWNDPKAAELYRNQQARTLIRSIEVYTDESKTQARTVFFNIKCMGNTYETVKTIFSVPDKKAALLAQAKKEMMSFRDKYNELNELAKVMAAIEESIAV